MRLTKKQMDDIVDLLQLQYYVFIDKRTGAYNHSSEAEFEEIHEDEESIWKTLTKPELEFLRINPPSFQYLRQAFSSFGTKHMLVGQWNQINKLAIYFTETGDAEPLYLVLRRCGFLAEWEQHMKSVYVKYVQDAILPWDERLWHLQ